MNKPIDFVITWVDGSDPVWLEKKNKYLYNGANSESSAKNRYRDWGLLKYWFRCVEKYTPWVNNIYLITDHQVPDWINIDNPKLKLINHEDYIPQEYLPTFNSTVIELFINRIEGLSDNFVYFNDDMFVVNNVDESYFFQNNIPVDSFIFNAVSVFSKNSTVEHTVLNNLELLSEEFNKSKVIKNNYKKIMNIKYGKQLIRNILLSKWKGYTGMYNPHMAIPYNKSSFDYITSKYSSHIDSTGNHKYRDKNDINHWICRYYQLLSGNFIPRRINKDKYYSLTNNNTNFINNLIKGNYNLICINDNDSNIDYESVKKELICGFEQLVPNKSSFEK